VGIPSFSTGGCGHLQKAAHIGEQLQMVAFLLPIYYFFAADQYEDSLNPETASPPVSGFR